MKSVVSINTPIPRVDDYLDYLSGGSLRDYDIAVFRPVLPYLERISFSAGGSCLSIESMATMTKAIEHWKSEINSALSAGKTIFVIMDEVTTDKGATGSTSKNRQTTYSSSSFNNYNALPVSLDLANVNGKRIIINDKSYHGLYESLKDVISYKAIIKSNVTTKIYSTRDGATVGGLIRIRDCPGAIVLLPYFNFDEEEFGEQTDDGEVWTSEALQIGGALLGQLIAVDKLVRSSDTYSPAPNWLESVQVPQAVSRFDQTIAELDSQIEALKRERDKQEFSKADLMGFIHLLYETGKPLERSIEKSLRLLGYTAETLRIDDLEIDHVIVSPSGKRMIGESEGRDNSAIDITKFRQLESNIGEDLQREDVSEPAKGILFGNGFRLKSPDEREEHFTQKSITNSKRLGSSLVRTADLYFVVSYLLDHPNDEAFRSACRLAIEDTPGGIVKFPEPPV